MSKQNGRLKGKALVIGASMAGLLAARALADFFEEVILLERDTFPAAGMNRKGVPQGKHTHVLLELGRDHMETFFPGFTQELARRGAVTMEDVSRDVRWYYGSDYHQPGLGGFSGVGVSRPTLEALVRERVLDLPNVKAIEGCSALGLVATADKGRVSGLQVELRHGEVRKETMTADLVVDASGRGSRSPSWLEALGYERPKQEEVAVGVGYATCYYRRRPGDIGGLKGIVVMSKPPNKRVGVLLAQDKNRWVLTVGGYLGDHAPTEYEGFLQAASEMQAPEISEMIQDREPYGAPVPYKFRANLRHHYEEMAAFPSGYLVLGDAICSFNPVYGQGMTVAAAEAMALSQCLAQGDERLAQRFFEEAGQIVDLAWNAAVGNDLNYPEVEGPRTPAVRFLNWYMGKLHRAAYDDAEVSIAFLRVINMIAPPTTLLSPRIVWRVMKGNIGRTKRLAGEKRDRMPAGTVREHDHSPATR
jgi:2-polyprenyl-6-methoxyphenol hydroxylase-like FAD-dependent oxidoreductase